MADLNIAIMLSNLRMGREEGLKKAAEMDVEGVQISATGEWDARKLDSDDRQQLAAEIDGLGLAISAISCWGGNVDLGEEEGWDSNIEWGRKNLEMAADLGCNIWQSHCGIMPEDRHDPAWDRFIEAMSILGKHGENVGSCVAIETGPEPPYVLLKLIHEVGSPAIRINWDPANLILWPARYAKELGEEYDREKWIERYQPNEGARALAEYIVHTHAKDALVRADGTRQEVPLGSGWVDWPRYVGYLLEAGFDGYFAIERETGDEPVKDIQAAIDFLRGL